jgi:hypothetical protein
MGGQYIDSPIQTLCISTDKRDNINFLGHILNITRDNANILLQVSKEISLEISIVQKINI